MSALHPRPRLELAEILRAHGAAYEARHPLSSQQRAVLRRLSACRTAALGGHTHSCDACGTVQVSYNSCRDRHCPKCQASRQIAWVQGRLARLLPVPYFHVVFTLPEELNPLGLKNQRWFYNLLFQAASQTLLQLAADPRRLGGQIGFTAVLHTWGQNLLFHPHLHCVVTGGGLSPDGKRWIAGREDFFLPAKVLGRMFRGKFLAGLRAAYQAGKLELTGSVHALREPRHFQRLLDRLYRQSWVVYAKPPFGGAEQVYRYLGRYTHRVALSNSRLLKHADGRVTFRYKDYADGQRQKEMTLDAEEFIRRFLLHVLPKGFVRIRHYGLLAGRNVDTKLATCRQLLGAATQEEPDDPRSVTPASNVDGANEKESCLKCPRCQGPLRRLEFKSPSPSLASNVPRISTPAGWNTS